MYLNLNLGKTVCDISTLEVSIIYTRIGDTWKRTVLDKRKCQVRDKKIISISSFPNMDAVGVFQSDIKAYANGVTVSDDKLKEIFA